MRAFTTMLLTALATDPVAVAQKISLGVVGGAALTNDYGGSGTRVLRFTEASTITQTGSSSAHGPILGAKFQLWFTDKLAFEANLLRRSAEWRGRYDFNPPWILNGEPITSLPEFASDVTWEVPLLLKYQLPAPASLARFRPFIEAGPSLRPWLYSQNDARAGITEGVGFRIPTRRVPFEPVVRYTRWGAPRLNYPIAKLDQIELLVGVNTPSASGRPAVAGRTLRFGMIGGFGLTGDFQAKEGYSSALSKMIGLSLGAPIGGNWAVEMNALYRPRILSERQRATVLTWEFPVLASYRFQVGRLHPFLEAGPSFRSSGNTNNSNPSRFGATAGAGLHMRLRGLQISPQLRYTHWGADPPSEYPPQQPFSRRNQVDAPIGFSF